MTILIKFIGEQVFYGFKKNKRVDNWVISNIHNPHQPHDWKICVLHHNANRYENTTMV